MATFSVLVLIVYLTIAFYVVYRARQTLIEEKQLKQAAIVVGKAVVKPLSDDLDKMINSQLEPLGLKGAIGVSLGREQVVDVDKLIQWPVKIENRTTTYALFVEWDKSSLTNLQGQARTLACVTPNQGQSQLPSLTPPSDKLQENFTIFSQPESPVPFIPSVVLFKLAKEQKACNLSLRLVLRLQEVGLYTNQYTLVLACGFQFRIATLEEVLASAKK